MSAASVPPPESAGIRRLASAWALDLGLCAAAFTLWVFSGFTWHVPALAVGGALLARLLAPLFPRRMRSWLGPLVFAVTFLYLLTQVSVLAWGVAVSLVGTTVGLARLPRWGVLASSAGLGAACAVGLLVSGHEAAVQQQLQAIADHEAKASALRANDPTLLLTALKRLIVSDDPVGCFYFSDAAKAQLAASVRAADCPAAIHTLHQQVREPVRFESPRLPNGAITRSPGGEMASLNACSPSATAGGPPLGVLTLARQPGSGYLVTGYTPCGP